MAARKRLTRIGALRAACWLKSEPIDGAELELPARVRTACRLAEVGVADDADVAVRREVLVVEHGADVSSGLDAVLARQRERPRQSEVGESDRRAARGIPPFGRSHVAGPRGRAEDLRRAGQVLRVAN